jgi:hypothetical protein
VVGLKAQDCPGYGGPTIADCMASGICGCIYGDAVQHIERLRAALKPFAEKARDADERAIRDAQDGELVWVRVTWGEFKAAKAALGDETPRDRCNRRGYHIASAEGVAKFRYDQTGTCLDCGVVGGNNG